MEENTLANNAIKLILQILSNDSITGFMKMDAICRLCDEYKTKLEIDKDRHE